MDDTSPATKADINASQQSMKDYIDAIHLSLKNDIYQGIDQVLIVLNNIDKRLSPTVKDHERRIRKLEKITA